MKSKVLASSILTIVLCFSLIVGSTFALFTSEDEFDIAITAGKVDLDASVDALKLYSVKDAQGATPETVDENGNGYIFEEQYNYTFANGGYASWDESVLSLTNITPGDKVEFNITGTNNSNVAVLYRYSVKVVEGDLLMSGLDISVNGTKYEALKSYTSAWETLPAGDITPVPVVIELPVYQGNEYQEESCKIAVTLEAVQGNAVVSGEETVEQYLYSTAADLQAAVNEGGMIVLGADVDMNGAALQIPENGNVILDLNGYTLTSKDGGQGNWMAVKVNRGANLTIMDSSNQNTGKIVSSCYGVYVQPGATFTMNGGTLSVSGNGAYDMGVVIWNGEFVMNEGTIDAQYCVWASDYWKNAGDAAAVDCKITIDNGCVLNGLEGQIDVSEAPSAIIDVPNGAEVEDQKAVADAKGLQEAIDQGYVEQIVLAADIDMGDAALQIPANSNITLDLNGYTLSLTSTAASASCAINNKGNLTIKNGTVTYEGVGDPSFGYGTNTINNTGKLIIDGATVINTTNSGSSVAIDCGAGAELIVNSGEIISEKNAIRLCPFGAAAINCTINGGTITGARAIQIQLPSNKPADAPEINLTVNGGTLNGTGDISIYSYSAGQSFDNVTVTITGGIFNNDVLFGGGNAKTTQETVTVTGGTFAGWLGRYVVDDGTNDGWEDIVKP